jgi:hypothetical protein
LLGFLGYLQYLQYLQYSHIQPWFLFPSSHILPLNQRHVIWLSQRTEPDDFPSRQGPLIQASRLMLHNKKHACNITWYILYPLVNLHR